MSGRVENPEDWKQRKDWDGRKEERDLEVNQMMLGFTAIRGITQRVLSDTSLTKDIEPTDDDVGKFKEWLVQIAPYFHPRIFPDYATHLLAVSIGQRKFAEKTHHPNPHLRALQGFSHDIPMVSCPHYLRKNVLYRTFTKELGFRDLFQGEGDYVPKILGRGEHPILSIEDMTTEERVEDLIDNIMKVNGNGRIRTWEEFAQITMNPQEQQRIYGQMDRSTRTQHLWPSTTFGMDALHNRGKIFLASKLVTQEKEWFEREYGIETEELIEEVQEELNTQGNKDWILRVRNAQETLDRGVSQELERPEIQAIVVDVGGVLLRVQNEDLLFRQMAKVLSNNIHGRKVTMEDVYKAMATTFKKTEQKDGKTVVHSPGFDGKLKGQQYLEVLCEELGISSAGFGWEKVFQHPEIYFAQNAIEGMRSIISKLNRSGRRIVIFSDAILPIADYVRKFVLENYILKNQNDILISSELGLSKRSDTVGVYNHLAKRMGFAPGQILVIDDNIDYTTKARAAGFRAFTFREGFNQQGERITSSQRLLEELRLGRLISN